MSTTEEYFFDNNITVCKTKYTVTITYFSTNEGQYVENFEGKLFKEVSEDNWEEIKKADAATSASI